MSKNNLVSDGDDHGVNKSADVRNDHQCEAVAYSAPSHRDSYEIIVKLHSLPLLRERHAP